MEYSPMMLLMLWALTPSSEGSGSGVPATVEELSPPAMTVHQEYFTFNHGKPFLAEQDPLTGQILNLKTTPVSGQDDYMYEEEEEEGDGIDRKDGPKVYTRNDIVSPSKDPDLHKFLNLPVHYSSADKFPLISSSYANTKVQGHNAASYPNNHRPAAPTTSTVSPSYYPHKTSSTTASTTTSTSTTTTTTTTTTKPPTTTTAQRTTSTTTKPPPAAYEYEYEYDYDKEPEQNKNTNSRPSSGGILDFFDKDYAFLGTSEEDKNSTQGVMFTYGMSAPTTDNKKEEPTMISSNSNLFIPSDYLKPPSLNKTEPKENKTTIYATPETKPTPTEAVVTTNVPEQKETEAPVTVIADSKGEEAMQLGMSSTTTPPPTTTLKVETTTKPAVKVPFFPTISPKEKENTVVSKPVHENENENQPRPTNQPIQNSPQETRPTEGTPGTPLKPLQFHHPYLKPQDIFALQNRPADEHMRPYNTYQRPYVNSNVPPEMQPPKKPAESNYFPKPVQDSYGSHSQQAGDSVQYKPHSNRPIESLQNKPPHSQEHYRPQYESRPTAQQVHNAGNSAQNKPSDMKPQPQENKQKPEPSSTGSRPVYPGLPIRPTDPAYSSHNRPYDVHHKEVQHRPSEVLQQHRPQEKPQNQLPQRPPVGRPTDNRYPPQAHGAVRPQEFQPDHRPHMPEYRPFPPRTEDMKPTNIQEFNVALGSKVPDFNKNKPEPSTVNNNYQVQFTQPSKVENHFIKVSPGQENPSYSLQTSFSIGVPPPNEAQGTATVTNVGQTVNQGLSKPGQGVGQVLFPDDDNKKPPAATRPWGFEEKRPTPPVSEGEKYPRPPWESHLKPPLVFNHLKKEPYPFKRPKPTRPDLPNILPQFRPNAKIGHADPHVYLKTPYDTLRPPPLPRPQFLRAEPPMPEEEKLVHRRNGQTPRPAPLPIQPIIQTSKRGALRSEDEKTDPVFVVYPSNNAQDGVVVGTRGPQRPLPPDNLDIVEDSFPLDTNKNFQSRVDTPILKGKPTPKPVIKNEFPYPLVKPTEITEEKTAATEKVTKEYTAFSPTVSPAEKEHDTEINVIPYLQDYMPFATKKPLQDPPKWNVGDDIKPISVTLKTQKTEETTNKVENHKTGDLPTPQDFQAPFHASLSAPSQGWSVVRPRPEPEKEDETTTAKTVEESEGKFDPQNFKPQFEGGFQPIIPPIEEAEDKKPVKNEKDTR